MMKRKKWINALISAVLAGALGCFAQLAASQSSVWYATLTILVGIGLGLNILCGPDTSK